MIEVLTPKRFLQIVPLTATINIFDSDSTLCMQFDIPRCDAHSGAWLRGMMHTANSNFFKNVRLCVFEFFMPFNYVLSKNVWSKKDSTMCDLQYNFHSNILRLHREISIVKFWIKTDIWQVTGSAVWCTPWSLTPRREAHRGVWLCGGMDTTESF